MPAPRLLSLALIVSLALPVAAFSQPAIPTGDVWPAPSDQGGAHAVVAPIQGAPVPSGDVWLIPQTSADTADSTLAVSPSKNNVGQTATVDRKMPD
jgi:hypothetical protein